MNLVFHDVTVQEKHRTVIHHLSFSLKAGETASVLGASRSGKSTLLLAASGHIPMTGGWVGITGEPPAELSGDEVRKPTWRELGVGPIPNFSPLFDTLTVREHVFFQGRLHRQKMTKRRVEEILASYALLDVQQQRVKDLDQFAYFRTALALVTIHQPPFILLDEPESGLTNDEWIKSRQYLRSLTEAGHGVLYTTVLESAATSADTVVYLPSGEVVQS